MVAGSNPAGGTSFDADEFQGPRAVRRPDHPPAGSQEVSESSKGARSTILVTGRFSSYLGGWGTDTKSPLDGHRLCGRVVRQRPAKPSTPVQVRPETPRGPAGLQRPHSSVGQSGSLVVSRSPVKFRLGAPTDTRSAHFGVWESLAIRLVRDEETGGSNPSTPTLVVHRHNRFGDVAERRMQRVASA